MQRLFVALACAVTVMAWTTLTGCVSSSSRIQTAPEQTAPAVEAMAFDKKQTSLPAEFPVEMPVPDGKVTAVQQQGSDAWVYELDLRASMTDVASWYERALGASNWQLTSRDPADGRVRLLFSKGDAQTEVMLTSKTSGTHAVVSVGVGVPVGQTY